MHYQHIALLCAIVVKQTLKFWHITPDAPAGLFPATVMISSFRGRYKTLHNACESTFLWDMTTFNIDLFFWINEQCFPYMYEGYVSITFGGRIIFAIKCSQLNLKISFKYKCNSESYLLLVFELFIFSSEDYFSQKYSKWYSLGVMED